MATLNIGSLKIGHGRPCFVIAEIGQNHQGCMETAKSLIVAAKKAGADCVKFQKTDLEEKFNLAALERAYDSPHSWGKTYGEHKRHLEFDEVQFSELQKYAKEVGVLFTASAMDQRSVDLLANMKVPFIKIGSGDSNNLPMVEYAASKHVPLVISTGMIDKEQVTKIYDTVKKHHLNFCLLHCVSSYPTPFDECNLNVIRDYQESFPDICIGYSGHEVGISISSAAVALGAKLIERHVTMDKSWKGSDHSCSLLPLELANLVQQIRIVESSLGDPMKKICRSELPCIQKLQKSLTAANDLKINHTLREEDIKIKVTEPKGLNGIHYESTIGRKLRIDKLQDDPFFDTDFI